MIADANQTVYGFHTVTFQGVILDKDPFVWSDFNASNNVLPMFEDPVLALDDGIYLGTERGSNYDGNWLI